MFYEKIKIEWNEIAQNKYVFYRNRAASRKSQAVRE